MASSPSSLPPWAKRREDPNPPDGWQEMPLVAASDIRFSNVDKKSYVSEKPVRLCNYMDVYNKEYVRGNEDFMHATASEGEVARFAVQSGDVIITKDSETPDDIGVPAVVLDAPDDLLCGYHLALIRPRPDKVDPVFLAKQVAHHRISRYYARLANGLTRYGLTNTVVENTPVWLPEPPEQHRVAGILRGIDEAIAKTEALIAKLKAIKRGLLHDLLTRGLDDNGELRDPEKHPEQFKPSLIGLFPKTWTCAAVREISETFAGGTPPRNAAGMFGGSIPWVKSAEVNLREISSTEETLTERGFFASSTRWVEAGSPLIAMYGATAGVVGWLAVRAVTNQAVLAIPPRSPDTNARWLYWVLRCRQWRLQAAIQGSGQPNLSKGIIDDIALPVPEPEEQIQIASLMDSLEDRLLSEECYCVKLKSIKKGLMQDLLTGRVRVNAEASVKER